MRKDWVKATNTEGRTVWLNLACALTIHRHSEGYTYVRFGTLIKQEHVFTEVVKETPEQLIPV